MKQLACGKLQDGTWSMARTTAIPDDVVPTRFILLTIVSGKL